MKKNDNSENNSSSIVKFITGNAIKGTMNLSGAKQLAEKYLNDNKYKNNDHRIDSLIKHESTKNFASGFVTGLGGLMTLPISIPAAVGASWLVQARLCAAIAHICGYDIDDEKVKTVIVLSVLGDAGKEVLKEAGIKISQDIARQIVKNTTEKVVYQLNKKIGFKLVSKVTQKSLSSTMGKAIPLIGGVIGGSIDALACQAVGKSAKYYFLKDTITLEK